jgi:Ca2+-transporting ATPase
MSVVAQGFVVDEEGLTDEEAARRLLADGPNELPTEAQRSLSRQVVDVLREPMLLLLVVAGAVNFVLAEPLDGSILMVFVVVVVAISVYQEHRTESALTALRDLSSPRALVRRSGQQQRIAGRDVVVGDVVFLAEGDRIPADIVLVECANFTVDESALTGESVPVRKFRATDEPHDRVGAPGGEASPFSYSGTLAVAGHAIGVVAATGAHTVLGGIGTALRQTETTRTRLQQEIEKLVRVIALLAVVVAVTVVVAYGLTRHRWLDAALAGTATAMAMLPEEFPVVLTVFLALGAWRMSRHHVLTRRPPVIEALGAATVVCVDKTGTLTENRMKVAALATHEWIQVRDAHVIGDELHPLVEYAMLASPIDPFDPTDRAFRVFGDLTLAATEHLHPDWILEREYPLSDHLLALSHVWRAPGSRQHLVASKGAPEAIVDLCHLAPHDAEVVMALVASAAAEGHRVLGVAVARFDAALELPSEAHDFEFEFVGLAALHDPVRPTAITAVGQCAAAGIRTVMITGDNRTTAQAIAREVGLARVDHVVNGSDFAAMSDSERVLAAASTDVFARMVPEQKLQLVRALQSSGEVVAMTGDGVNDAPALRAADIGIAMGQRGTDVAREAAALVITDDDFTSIATGVRMGRGIYDNARKAMAYIVAVHVPIVGMSLLPLFVRSWPVVLLPTQIAFLELIIDPACSVVFESEQTDPRIMEQPPRSRGARLFDRTSLWLSVAQGCGTLAAAVATYLVCVARGLSADEVRSATFVTLVLSNLGLIMVNRSWRLSLVATFRERRNPTLGWIVASALAVLTAVLLLPGGRRVFRLGNLSFPSLLLAAGFSIAGLAWFEGWKAWRRFREGAPAPLR